MPRLYPPYPMKILRGMSNYFSVDPAAKKRHNVGSTAWNAAISKDGPVAWYRHSTGFVDIDDSGNSNDFGLVSQNVTGVDGILGDGAGSYNGTTSYQVATNSATIQELPGIGTTYNDVSVEMIIKLNSVAANQGIIGKGLWGGNIGWFTYVSTNSDIVLVIYRNTGPTLVSSPNSSLTVDGNYHHVVICFSGDYVPGSSGSCEIYIDDTSVSIDADIPGSIGSLNTDAGYGLVAGSIYSGTYANFYNGVIEDVILYNYRLTASQVHKHFIKTGI